MTLDVSIVIPSYEGRSVLPATLRALDRALATSALRCEVIIVDDASRDGGEEIVARHHPAVRWFRQPENRGFGPASNRGAAEARAPLVFFHNSDVSAHPGFIEPLVARLAEPDCFAATSLNLSETGAVRRPHLVTPELKRGQIRLRGPDLDEVWRAKRLEGTEPIYTFFGSGGSLLVNRERFLRIGGFAEVFSPYYYEDVDLGWRAWRRGWSTVLDPRSVVTHRDGGAIVTTQKRRTVKRVRKRNRFLLLWRNLVDPGALERDHLRRLPLHLLGAGARGRGSVLHGFAAALARRRGLAAFRAEERAAAKRSDAEIFALLRESRTRLAQSVAGSSESSSA